MIDTHAHLNLEPLSTQTDAVIDRAHQAGVESLICIGTSLSTSQEAIALASQHAVIFASVGVHPDEIELSDGLSKLELYKKQLAHLVSDPKVVAIGECGLDYSRLPAKQGDQTALITQQKKLFGLQIQLALANHKTLVVHCRSGQDTPDAYADMVDTLKHFCLPAGRFPTFVLHCASGTPAYIQECLELGAYVSFAGNVTYKNAQAIQSLLPLVPKQRLLIETDCPFLSPVPVRGKTNEPAFLSHTAHFIASAVSLSFDELDALTTNNAKLCFGLS